MHGRHSGRHPGNRVVQRSRRSALLGVSPQRRRYGAFIHRASLEASGGLAGGEDDGVIAPASRPDSADGGEQERIRHGACHGHELSDNGRDAARSLRAGGVSVARGGEYGGRRGKRVRGNATALALEREQSGVSEICITSFATTSKATASATASPESSKKTAAIEYKSRYS